MRSRVSPSHARSIASRTRLREANTLGCLNIACYIIWQGAEPVTCLNGRVRRRFSALIKIDQLTDRGLRRRVLQRVISRAAKHSRSCDSRMRWFDWNCIQFNSRKLLEIIQSDSPINSVASFGRNSHHFFVNGGDVYLWTRVVCWLFTLVSKIR